MFGVFRHETDSSLWLAAIYVFLQDNSQLYAEKSFYLNFKACTLALLYRNLVLAYTSWKVTWLLSSYWLLIDISNKE